MPYRYAAPVAPAVAARTEGHPFSLRRTLAAFDVLAGADFVLVEGAGGLLVPFADNLLGADVAAALGIPLLIVARAGLGTINHTLLTVAEARRRELVITGIILNRVCAEADPSEATNAAEIARLSGVPVLGTVEHIPAADRHNPAALAAAIACASETAAPRVTPPVVHRTGATPRLQSATPARTRSASTSVRLPSAQSGAPRTTMASTRPAGPGTMSGRPSSRTRSPSIICRCRSARTAGRACPRRPPRR